jgi:hypothetical protein
MVLTEHALSVLIQHPVEINARSVGMPTDVAKRGRSVEFDLLLCA